MTTEKGCKCTVAKFVQSCDHFFPRLRSPLSNITQLNGLSQVVQIGHSNSKKTRFQQVPQVVFNSPSLHLTPEPNNQVAPSPSDLLLTQGRAPHTGGGEQGPQETQISTITVRVATSNISSPSQRSTANTRNHDPVNHEGAHQQVRGDHEEDTESKLLELHKQVAKMQSDLVKL